jgi:uncharacterized protein
LAQGRRPVRGHGAPLERQGDLGLGGSPAPVLWPVYAFESLSKLDFAPLVAAAPDLVILGTGPRQRFISPGLIGDLLSQRIGVECMDNQAACRTYNILMAEGRKVALALIFPDQQTKTPEQGD